MGQKEMSGQRESTVSRASASTDLTVRSGLSDIGPRSTATSSVGSSSGILKRDDFEILSYIPDEMTIDDINEQIQAINDANNFVKNELVVFEQFSEEVEKEMEEWEEENIEEEAVVDQRRKTLTRRKSRKPEVHLLNIQTKINLASKHEKILKKERIKKIMEYEKELDGVKNMIDCQGYRENECRKYSYEFKRDVVNRPKPVSSSGVKTLQNVIMYSAEAFIKCTNDKIKRMEASVNHLEDSSKKLAQHNKQLKKQLGNKAQAELTEVDFNHLKVQNELFIADIEAKNNEFTNLKVQSQNIEHVSKRRKNEMAEAMRFHVHTLNQMERRQEQMRILDKEIAKAEDDCDQALELNKKLKSELNSFDPCPVMDYVKQTAKTQDIKRTVTEMHRKVDINQLMKKTYIKQLRGLNSGYLHQ